MTERKKKIALGTAVCVLLFLIGAYYVKQHDVKLKQVPSQAMLIGVIDLKQAMKEHPRYVDLEKLRAQRALLAIEGKTRKLAAVSGPELSAQPFKEAGEQQLQQEKNKLRQQQREELAQMERDLRLTTAAKRDADRKAVSDLYANDIFNCTLLLGNAESLRLSEPQKNELKQKINDLKQQRAAQMATVEKQYEEYIYSQLQAQRDQYQKENQAADQQSEQRMASETAARVLMATDRNAAVLDMSRSPLSQNAAERSNTEAALAAKDNEIRLLEDLIVKDIASKAAKSAIGHHLEYVFADVFVNVSALDVTEEVVSEIKPGKI